MLLRSCVNVPKAILSERNAAIRITFKALIFLQTDGILLFQYPKLYPLGA